MQPNNKHRDKLRKEKGNEEYKKQQAEYMKAYRQAKKAQQPQQLDIKTIGGSQCGRDRPGFGCHAVSEKLRAIQYYRVLNI